MPVIHIQNRTTTSNLDFEQSCLSDKSLILIDGEGDTDAFSMEFFVGRSWSENYGPSIEMYQIDAQHGLQLGPHGSIVIEVSSEIRMPHNLYGVIVPTGSLFLDRGILIAPAKIEPAFSGKLKLRLFNTTGRKHVLKIGEKVASAIFFPVETTYRHAPVTKSVAFPKGKVPFTTRSSAWLRANTNQVISWVTQIVSGAVIASVLAYFVYPAFWPRESLPPDKTDSAAPVAPNQDAEGVGVQQNSGQGAARLDDDKSVGGLNTVER